VKRTGDLQDEGFLENPHFNQWLYHVRTDRRWHELAAFVAEDRGCWPDRPRTLNTLLRHLRTVHTSAPAAPTERALRSAFQAYRNFLESGDRITKRIGPDPLPADQRRVLKSYLILPQTRQRIEKLRDLLELDSLGSVIDTLIEARYEKEIAKRKRRRH
jgi:hypothetical protein